MNRSVYKLLAAQNAVVITDVKLFPVPLLDSGIDKLAIRGPRPLSPSAKVTKHRIDINYLRYFQTKISAMTAVLILLRTIHDASADWIQMDVAHQFGQISFALAQRCFIPSLHQMAAALMSSIVILTITGKRPLHDPANVVRLSLYQQVHVVGHETISVKKERQQPLLLCQQREELFVIRCAVEYLSAIIATGDDVIQTTGNFQARFAGHKAADTKPTLQLRQSTCAASIDQKEVCQSCEKVCLSTCGNQNFLQERIAKIASLTPFCGFFFSSAARFKRQSNN